MIKEIIDKILLNEPDVIYSEEVIDHRFTVKLSSTKDKNRCIIFAASVGDSEDKKDALRIELLRNALIGAIYGINYSN